MHMLIAHVSTALTGGKATTNQPHSPCVPSKLLHSMIWNCMKLHVLASTQIGGVSRDSFMLIVAIYQLRLIAQALLWLIDVHLQSCCIQWFGVAHNAQVTPRARGSAQIVEWSRASSMLIAAINQLCLIAMIDCLARAQMGSEHVHKSVYTW